MAADLEMDRFRTHIFHAPPSLKFFPIGIFWFTQTGGAENEPKFQSDSTIGFEKIWIVKPHEPNQIPLDLIRFGL